MDTKDLIACLLINEEIDDNLNLIKEEKEDVKIYTKEKLFNFSKDDTKDNKVIE